MVPDTISLINIERPTLNQSNMDRSHTETLITQSVIISASRRDERPPKGNCVADIDDFLGSEIPG